MRELARVKKFADQTQLGEWLRAQSDASIAAFWKLIAQFVQWVIARADASRWTHAGRAEVFFDDTQIEVHGPSFEGAQTNYEGNRALSWQTFWFGPFLLQADLGSPGDVRRALPGFLREHRPLWQERASDFLADSASSSAEYLRAIEQAGFTHWSVSYNKWTRGPERTAAALPEKFWSAATTTRWRDGVQVTEQHAGLRHTPAPGDFTFALACARWKKEDEMFWRYAFVAHDPRRTDAAGVMARHRLKGAKEQLFKDVLRGLDLHHPPCESLVGQPDVLRHRGAGLQPDQSGADIVSARRMPGLDRADAAQTDGAPARAAGAARARARGASGRGGELAGLVARVAGALVAAERGRTEHGAFGLSRHRERNAFFGRAARPQRSVAPARAKKLRPRRAIIFSTGLAALIGPPAGP